MTPLKAALDCKRLFRPEWVFLMLALPFGSAFLLLTPPYQVPDEAAHFHRAFEISEGRLLPVKEENQTGDYLPRHVADLAQTFAHLRMHPERKTSAAEIRSAVDVDLGDERVFAGFSNTAVYPPLPFAPQALGIALARVFSSSVLVCFYAGRLANLLAATLVFFLSVRVAPLGKWAFVVLALTPMTLFESASLSSDALTNAIAFLLLASFLRCACGPVQELGGADIAILVGLVIALALVKQGYLLLVLGYFLIPPQRLNSRKRYAAVFALLLGCELLVAAAWALIVRDVYTPVVPGKIDPQAQLHGMIAHPQDFLRAVVRSSTRDAPGTLREYLGVLGTLDTPLSDWLLVVLGVILVVTALAAFRPPGTISGRQALVALLAALVTYLSLLTVIHLTWDAVGTAKSIDVQGRYYIPLGPLVAVGLGGVGQRLPAQIGRLRAVLPLLGTAAPACVLAAALVVLHQRYYVDTALAAAERHFDQGQELLKQKGKERQAREHFEEAVRLNPEHAAAHFNLGALLAADQPRQSIAHYRQAARLDPESVRVHNNLANALARQGLFEEAIEHYREALRIDPADTSVRRSLQHAEQTQQRLQRSLERIAQVIQACAQASRSEKRFAGTAREGFYLEASQGEVLTPAGVPPLPQTPYLWRVPPPSGEPVPAPQSWGTLLQSMQRRPFFACSVDLVGWRRVFVFPPPVNAALLADEDVSWLFQVPMSALSAEEIAREREHRHQQGLQMPRDLRPRPRSQGRR
jgi:uncharacterized membrane protein/Tfp pilus assembly protein PilF